MCKGGRKQVVAVDVVRGGWRAVLAFMLWCMVWATVQDAALAAPAVDLTPEERSWIGAHPVIRVGLDPGFPPMEYVDREGRAQGMTLDYLQLLEARLGLRFETDASVSWNEAVNRARAHELDLLPCVAETHRRKDFLAFTTPYLFIPSVLVTRADLLEDGQTLTLASMAGRTMAAAEGGYSFDRLRSEYPQIPLLITNTPGEALEAVALGKAEAVLENQATAMQLIKDLGLVNLVVAGRSEYHEDHFTMGVRNDWPLLLAILNKGLATITPEEHVRILDKWSGIGGELVREPGTVSTRTLVVAAGVLAAALVLFLSWNWLLRREIRSRRAAEAALRESEARLAMILAATGDGLWQCDLATGACHFSPSWYALLGYDPGELPARWGAFEHLTHPADQQSLQALRQGTCMDKQGRFRLETRMLCKDGRWLPVLARGRVVARDPSGAPLLVAGVHSDVSIRRQAEAALSESEQRAQALFENSPIALMDKDFSDVKTYLDGLRASGVEDLRAYFEAHPQALRYAVALIKVRQLNAMCVRLFEAEDKRSLLQGLNAVFGDRTYKDILESIATFDGGQTVTEVETEYRTLKGRQLPVLVRAQLARGSEESWDQMLVSIQDLTAIKEAETLREEVDRITRHDLKNPLAAIISVPRLLLEEDTLTPHQRKALELLQETGMRMLRMINLSLDLSKMERGVYRLVAVPVDLAKVAMNVVEQGRASITDRPLDFVVLCEGGSCRDAVVQGRHMVLGEELLIFSMLSNLVSNAMDASDSGQAVTVSIERALHHVACHIHNHGVVPEHIREHLFEKYVTAKPGGTGLGCYSAKLMAETMRGEILVSSTPVTGTTVTVRLPRA